LEHPDTEIDRQADTHGHFRRLVSNNIAYAIAILIESDALTMLSEPCRPIG